LTKYSFFLKLRYGLTIPVKAGGVSSLASIRVTKKPIVKPCIFDDDNDGLDDDEEDFTSKGKQSEKKLIAQANTNANRMKKETQIEIEKALSQDPNVFEYDEIYDELESQKAKLDPKLKSQNQSKEVFMMTLFFSK
jgi:coiled-coil domain-containing protein 55